MLCHLSPRFRREGRAIATAETALSPIFCPYNVGDTHLQSALSTHMDQPPTEPPTLEIWLAERLQNIFQRPRPLKFEASLYGPLNMYLTTYFPLSRCFMIKPQATLRPAASTADSQGPAQVEVDDTASWDQLERSRPASPAFVNKDEEENEEEGNEEEGKNENGNDEGERDSEQEGDDLGDISMDTDDSYAQRTRQGVKNIGIPDFVVVKATGALDGDCIVLVIEVKKREWGKRRALFQLSRYLAIAAKKTSVRPLRGVLIRGRICTIIEYDEAMEHADLDSALEMATAGEEFNEFMNRIAAENWA